MTALSIYYTAPNIPWAELEGIWVKVGVELEFRCLKKRLFTLSEGHLGIKFKGLAVGYFGFPMIRLKNSILCFSSIEFLSLLFA